MRRQDVHIADPCHADWQEMHGDDQRRFCDACTKHVHFISEMTREEAHALLDTRADDHLCVRYIAHDDEVIFRDDPEPERRMYWQREGVNRLIAAAALALPMSLAAACDSPQAPVQPSVDAPIVIKDGQAPHLNTTSPAQPHTTADPDTQPGAGRAPTFKPTPPAEPPDQPPKHDEMMGKIAAPTPPEQPPAELPEADKTKDGADCAEKPKADKAPHPVMGRMPRRDTSKAPTPTPDVEKVADPGDARASTHSSKQRQSGETLNATETMGWIDD